MSTDLHAQLAAHRRLRAHGRGGGQLMPTRDAFGEPAVLAHPALLDPARQASCDEPLLAAVVVNSCIAGFCRSALVAQPTASAARVSPAAAAGLVGSTSSPGRRNARTAYPIYDDSGDRDHRHRRPHLPRLRRHRHAGTAIASAYMTSPRRRDRHAHRRHADGTATDVQATLRTADEIAAGQGALGFWHRRGAWPSSQTGRSTRSPSACGERWRRRR